MAGRRARCVVAIDTVLDAAVLRVEGLDAEVADRRGYVDGEEVSLFTDRRAACRGRRDAATIRTSDIYRDGEHTRPALDIVADVRAGDSGAPIVGEDGSVLALVWATQPAHRRPRLGPPDRRPRPPHRRRPSGATAPPVTCAR